MKTTVVVNTYLKEQEDRHLRLKQQCKAKRMLLNGFHWFGSDYDVFFGFYSPARKVIVLAHPVSYVLYHVAVAIISRSYACIRLFYLSQNIHVFSTCAVERGYSEPLRNYST